MTMVIDGSNGLKFPDNTNQQTAIGRNRIINGAMGIWQRGTSGFTASGNYSADRWLVSTGTSLSAVGQSSDVPAGYLYSLSVSGTNVPSARQYIEAKNCTDLVGQSVTVTVQIKQTSGAGSNAMYIYLAHANSADTFSGLTQIGSTTNLTTTSSWATYTATFTNLPSGAANGLALIIGSNSAGASTFLITGVQLEKGSTATSFDYRPYGTELALCQRYCLRISSSGASSGYMRYGQGRNESTTRNMTPIIFFQQMRANPTFSSTGTASNYAVYHGTTITACTNVSCADFSSNGATMTFDVASGLTAGAASEPISNNNTTSFVMFTAEL